MHKPFKELSKMSQVRYVRNFIHLPDQSKEQYGNGECASAENECDDTNIWPNNFLNSDKFDNCETLIDEADNLEQNNFNFDGEDVIMDTKNEAFSGTYHSKKADEDIFDNSSPPIYEGANISVLQSMLLIIKLSLKHNLTDTCVADILTIIKFHCLPTNYKKITLYKLKKYFHLQNNLYSKHFYCSECRKPLSNVDNECDDCKRHSHKNYFITLSITNQLQLIMKKDNILNLLNTRFHKDEQSTDCIQDLYDGKLYKDFVSNGFLNNPYNISFTWYTDGVPIFKSSNITIWPFYLRVNELPYSLRIRRENTVLAGLWFDSQKPSPNLLLKYFRDELQSLYTTGMNITIQKSSTPVTIRAVLLCGTGDLPAKSLFLNITQYNGKYGCLSCETEGESLRISNKKSITVFKYIDNFVPRTTQQTVIYGQNAFQNKVHRKNVCEKISVKGVKGLSALSCLMPDYIRGMAIDAMHGIFEGVAKKLLHLWLDSMYNQQPFSLRPVLKDIDILLLKIKPPKFIHRMPNSLSNYNTWKASELKTWFFYYSTPILKEFMRNDYFRHYCELVSAISILCSDKIFTSQLELSRKLLKSFVEKFEAPEFYGTRFCSMNIHQLLHLPDNVYELGPLWVNSCFSFEDINGQLARSVHGTSNIDSQIAASHHQILQFSTKIKQQEVGPLYNFILQYKKQSKIIECFNGCYSLGTYSKLIEIPADINHMNLISGTLRQYHRLLKNNLVYISKNYKSGILKQNSSIVKFLFKQQHCFGLLNYFLKISHCKCEGNKCLCNGSHFAIINPFSIQSKFTVLNSPEDIELPHIFNFTFTDLTVIIPVSELITTCILIENSTEFYIAQPINKHECE